MTMLLVRNNFLNEHIETKVFNVQTFMLIRTSQQLFAVKWTKTTSAYIGA